MKQRITLLLLVMILAATGFSPPPARGQDYYEALPEGGYEVPTRGSSDRGIPSYGEGISFVGDEGGTGEADGMIDGDSTIGEGYQTYTVKKGDTLGAISRKFFGSTANWKQIADANGITNPAALKVGRILRIPTTAAPRAGSGTIARRRVTYVPEPLPNLPPTPLALPPLRGSNERVLYSDGGLPQLILPDSGRQDDFPKRHVTFNGMTGLFHTMAGYPLGKGKFSTAFGVTWNKITRRDGHRLVAGEDGDYWSFPIALTYSAENFEVGMQMPFESYDVFAPITYNFRDGTDSGMGDVSLRLKFSSQNENMASALGIAAIFPTNDRIIGNTETNNAWEIFGAISTKRKEGGNFHVNAGYQAGDGNTAHEGVFFNVGFEYAANPSFTFIGEINTYNRINNGRSTDLTLGLRYHVKEGMAVSLAAPIALSNDMFFGYDYRLEGQMQYHY
jgi:LysM repeat protein